MNGRHNHPTLGKALHNAVQSLTLNVFSVCYLWPTSGHHCHILLGFHNDHDDDGDKDDDGRDYDGDGDKDDDENLEVEHWCPSLSDDSAQVSPTGVDSHSCQ